MNAETKVIADSSSYGVGAVLLQKYKHRSCCLCIKVKDMPKEALAVNWECERFLTYLLGGRFLIEIDHKLFVPLLESKQLDNLPPKFRLQLTRFNYSIENVPGKLLYTADTLSRASLQEEIDKTEQNHLTITSEQQLRA